MLRQIDYPTRIVILSELPEPKDLSFQWPNDRPLVPLSYPRCVLTPSSNLLSEHPRLRVPPPPSPLRPSKVFHQSPNTSQQSLILLFATHPRNPRLTPFLATLPKTRSRKFFICHTSRTPAGGLFFPFPYFVTSLLPYFFFQEPPVSKPKSSRSRIARE